MATTLCKHNPEVNWQTNKVKMSCCLTKCCTCTKEEKVEQCEQHVEVCWIQACCASPMPSVDDNMRNVPNVSHNSNDDDDSLSDNDNGVPINADDFPLKEGNHIFAVNFGGKVEEIHTMQNILRHIAKAFYQNSKTKSFCNTAPDYLHDFEDVFSKESLDILPNQKPWDHAIELIPNSGNKSCKVYPLSATKQE